MARPQGGLNGNGKNWLDRWMWEIIRLTTVAVIALGGAYWGISGHVDATSEKLADQHTEILRDIRNHCRSDEAVRHNQQTVLLDLLTIVDVLDDRWMAGLEPVPPRLRRSILDALSNLPDQKVC